MQRGAKLSQFSALSRGGILLPFLPLLPRGKTDVLKRVCEMRVLKENGVHREGWGADKVGEFPALPLAGLLR